MTIYKKGLKIVLNSDYHLPKLFISKTAGDKVTGA